MAARAHYEVRREGKTDHALHKTGGATERECRSMQGSARQLSLDEPGTTFEVRYRGYGELARDLLVAAYLDGEELDVRTPAKKDEEAGR
jgi:hypothetical protein